MGAISLDRSHKESRLTNSRFAKDMGDPTQNRTEVITKINNDVDDVLKLRLIERQKIEDLKKLDGY